MSHRDLMGVARFELGHQFKAREARDHFKDVLDVAEGGAVAVIRRGYPVVVVNRAVMDDALGVLAPLDVRSAATNGEVAFWLEDAPVHATGSNLDEAEDNFLDALLDYVDLWFRELRNAPNHKQHQHLAMRVAMFAGDADELRRVVFGDD